MKPNYEKVRFLASTRTSILLLCFLSQHAQTALAQVAGTFTPTGHMTAARAFHTATLLQDGRVLIAGGENVDKIGSASKTLASAELYDPATGTFAATGDITTARTRHTATLLPNGRVLIAGGSVTATAELYDPSSGTFSPTGNMITPQFSATATLLSNGKVLISGGAAFTDSFRSIAANPELYDPTDGTFAVTGGYGGTAPNPFGSGEWGMVGTSAALLPNGKVLIAGEPTAELYDPITNTFDLTGTMTTRPYGQVPSYIGGRTASLLTNGKVLVAGGGHEDFGRFDSAELYDPSIGAFTATSDMAWRRTGHTATLLPDGAALMVGGDTDICFVGGCSFAGSLASSEIYAPSRSTFGASGDMSTPRERPTATLLNGGRVLITGGMSYGGIGMFFGSLVSAEIYTPGVLVPAPELLSVSGDGQGQGSILHANSSRLASPADPAIAGEILEIYLTGLADGSVIPPRAAIGGRTAEILYFGNAPGWAGVNQVNVRVPGSIAPGTTIPVRLTYLGRHTNEVTITVR
jgi:hypothetical protein